MKQIVMFVMEQKAKFVSMLKKQTIAINKKPKRRESYGNCKKRTVFCKSHKENYLHRSKSIKIILKERRIGFE